MGRMGSFREKIMRFMAGRNGLDELARAESWIVLLLLLAALFSRWAPIYILALAIMVHMYFRVFSRNRSRRYAENQRYVQMRYRAVVAWNKKKTRFAQRKTYRFFRCPQCKQKVRVPKGHGKICITCPKCRKEFFRKS